MRESVSQSILLVSGTAPLLMRGAASAVALGLLSIPCFLIFTRVALKLGGFRPGAFSAFMLLFSLLLWGSYRLFRPWLLFRSRAAHIALLAEAFRTGRPPASGGQFGHGTELIEKRFGSVPRFFSFQGRLERAVRTTGRSIRPGGAMPVLCFLKSAFLAEVILACLLLRNDAGLREAAREASVRLFGRRGRFIGRAIPLLAANDAAYYLLLFVLFLPILFLFRPFGIPVLSGFLLTSILAWTAHQAFVHPLIMTALIAEFLRSAPEGDTDPAVWKKFESFFPEFVMLDNTETCQSGKK